MCFLEDLSHPPHFVVSLMDAIAGLRLVYADGIDPQSPSRELLPQMVERILAVLGDK
jgi:hypothetical protein